MRKYIIVLLLLLVPMSALALDKKLGTTNCVKIGIFDETGGGIASGLDITTPFSNLVIKVDCGSPASVTTVDETGDTIESEGGGYYYICFNDSMTNAVEDECVAWVEGQSGSDAEGLITKSPVKFKAVGATIDAVIPIGVITGTLSAGSTSTSLISTSFSATDTSDYIGWTAAVNGGTAIVKSFNSSTDTVSLSSSIGTVNTGDVVVLMPTSLWEILYRSRGGR